MHATDTTLNMHVLVCIFFFVLSGVTCSLAVKGFTIPSQGLPPICSIDWNDNHHSMHHRTAIEVQTEGFLVAEKSCLYP